MNNSREYRTWARGLVTNYSYHPTGELQSIDYADSTPDVSQTITRLGATATITDALGTHTYSYDNAGVLTQEAITGTLYNKTLNYNLATTGVVGRTFGLSIDGVSNHTVSYDSFGRLSAINNTQYGYTANSNFIGSVTAGNGLVTSFSYESNRDLLSSVDTKQSASSLAKMTYNNDFKRYAPIKNTMGKFSLYRRKKHVSKVIMTNCDVALHGEMGLST